MTHIEDSILLDRFREGLREARFETSDKLKQYIENNLPDGWFLMRYKVDLIFGIATIQIYHKDGVSIAEFVEFVEFVTPSDKVSRRGSGDNPSPTA